MDVKRLATDVIKKLYVYYVRPVMEYASPVWHGSITEEEAIAMERVQASVARCVSKSPWSTPKERLFESLDWPSLRWRRDVASMILSHKLLTSTLPHLFQNVSLLLLEQLGPGNKKASSTSSQSRQHIKIH